MSEHYSQHIYLWDHDIILNALDSFTVSIEEKFNSSEIEFEFDVEEIEEEYLVPDFEPSSKFVVHIKGKDSGDFFIEFSEKEEASAFIKKLYDKIEESAKAYHDRNSQASGSKDEYDYDGEY